MQRSFTDQLGREIAINYPPKRIISLVPSQTELLFDLGLDLEIVGITKFCIHPIDKFASRTKIGGTKKLDLDTIRNLKPDLIIGNKEENLQSDIELLMEEFPVWISDINNLEEAMLTINEIGTLVNRAPEASYLNHLIDAGFRDLQTLAKTAPFGGLGAAYFIWRKPYMVAGRNTFIDDILRKIGLNNVIEEVRYPEVTLSALQLLKPDFVFLSSEPYPFAQKHIEEMQNELPNAKIILVDGEMFSWYGSRLVKAVQYFFEFQKELC